MGYHADPPMGAQTDPGMVGTPGQDHARVADGASLLAPSAMRNPPQPQALAVMPSQLARLAEQYLREEVYGVQADATFRAKASDLGSFIAWFTQHNRAPDAPWIKQDTIELRFKTRSSAVICVLGCFGSSS